MCRGNKRTISRRTLLAVGARFQRQRHESWNPAVATCFRSHGAAALAAVTTTKYLFRGLDLQLTGNIVTVMAGLHQ